MHERYSVAITGIGLITPVGNSKDICWNKLINGCSGISFLPELKDFPFNVVGKVKDEKELLDKVISPNKQRKSSRFIHLAMIAGNEAMKDAGFSTEFPLSRDRFGVCMGVGIGGVQAISEASVSLDKFGVKRVSPFLIPSTISNQASAFLSMHWNLHGSTNAIVNACSSSGDSIGYAFRMIRDGYCDYMLAGGSESTITPLSLAAFGNMRALADPKKFNDPAGISRPFDKDRSGFVMGEGAGILVLERMDLAKKRDAKIYAEIVGYGSSSDAYHVTAMHPEGRGAVKAIEAALKDAKITKDKIGYINAHGTSTRMNDEVESFAIKKVFGDHSNKNQAGHLRVSSTKSMTGHLLGAAGATEVAFSALTIKNQIIPPTINLHDSDIKFDLDYVPQKAVAISCKQEKIEYAISNSFGFGGGNSVLVLKNFE